MHGAKLIGRHPASDPPAACSQASKGLSYSGLQIPRYESRGVRVAFPLELDVTIKWVPSEKYPVHIIVIASIVFSSRKINSKNVIFLLRSITKCKPFPELTPREWSQYPVSGEGRLPFKVTCWMCLERRQKVRLSTLVSHLRKGSQGRGKVKTIFLYPRRGTPYLKGLLRLHHPSV